MKNMRAIINRKQNIGTLDGVIMTKKEVLHKVYEHLMQGTAKLVIDTEETLMYILSEKK